jgi:hypothetical protein
MDPISALLSGGFTVAGMGLQLFGAHQASQAEGQISGLQTQELQQEQAENNVRQQAVAMQAQRKSIQNVREAQMAAARSRAAGVSAGAQFGSGAKAGEQMASAGAAYNSETISQDLQSANQMFSIDRNINNLKMQMGAAYTSLSSAQGIESMGAGLAGGAGSLGKLFGSAGGLFAGGGPSPDGT